MEANRSLLAVWATALSIKNTGLMIAKHGGAGCSLICGAKGQHSHCSMGLSHTWVRSNKGPTRCCGSGNGSVCEGNGVSATCVTWGRARRGLTLIEHEGAPSADLKASRIRG